MFAFIFCTAAHFYLAGCSLLAASISHFLTAIMKNLSPLFSITHSSSFSVINVSVNIKNTVDKDTTLGFLSLSKSSGGHAISFQIKP